MVMAACGGLGEVSSPVDLLVVGGAEVAEGGVPAARVVDAFDEGERGLGQVCGGASRCASVIEGKCLKSPSVVLPWSWATASRISRSDTFLMSPTCISFPGSAWVC